VLDEIQRAPELASYLQALVDADPRPGRFVLTGSHQFELMTPVSQSLAGRTALLRLLPFTLAEATRLRAGNDAGVAHVTARAWIDLLQTSYIVHLLPPWFTHGGKRLVKTPKLYFVDVGLACWLLGLREAEQVSRDPLWGSLFENFVVMEGLKGQLNAGQALQAYFYRDAEGHEVDLLMPAVRGLRAVEVKAGATVNPDCFKGLRTFSAHQPGAMDGGCVVYGGEEGQARSDWPVHPWRRLAAGPPRTRGTAEATWRRGH
jgi:predicted AAA+ superfamily ATPase